MTLEAQIFEPMICRSREEIVRALAHVREHRGMSQLEVDERAGFATGYTAKLERPDSPATPGERPTGRSAILAMFDYWLQSVGAAVVIIPDARGVPIKWQDAKPPKHRLPKITAKIEAKIRARLATAKKPRAEACRLAKQYRITVREVLAIRGRTQQQSIAA